MSNQANGNRQNAWTVQDLLSFGYLYLLVLGITSDSIYYGTVGINIISYSSILDVLLSPVVRLTDNLVFPAVIFVFPGLIYLWLKFIRELQKKKGPAARKTFLDDLPLMNMWLMFSALVIFSAFIGYGLGGGHALKRSLENGQLKTNHRITFQSGEVVEARLVGNNTGYIFYATENARTILVSPIQENVRSIEKIVKE